MARKLITLASTLHYNITWPSSCFRVKNKRELFNCNSIEGWHWL